MQTETHRPLWVRQSEYLIFLLSMSTEQQLKHYLIYTVREWIVSIMLFLVL